MTTDLKPETIKGFSKLSEPAQAMFKQFLAVYMPQWSNPEKHLPIKVAEKYDRSNGYYLRVDFPTTWLHVKAPYTWY